MHIKILIAGLFLVLAVEASYTSSPQKIRTKTATTKSIRVKIVIDEDFETRAAYIIQRLKFFRESSNIKDEKRLLATWTAENPSMLALEIVEKLSGQYQQDFNIQVAASGSPQKLMSTGRERASRLLYSIALMKCGCEDADVILGLRGFPLPDDTDHSSLINGFADPDIGRFAVAFDLAGDEAYLLEGILHTADHELRHLLIGAHTREEVGAEDDSAFMKRSNKLLKRGRWHMPTCIDFTF